MTDLQAYYLAALPGRIEALRSALRAAPDEVDACVAIRRIAHSLKGSGASYGFPRISEAADAAEHAADDELVARVETLLDVLRGTIAEGEADGPAAENRILVVEDDPDITHLIRSVLPAPGRELQCVESMATAEAALREAPPALVVLDLLLPDGDGRTLLMRMRERPATATVPVIVLSAATSQQALSECLALGADQVVAKPFDPDALAAAVHRQLQRSRDMRMATHRDALTGILNRAAFVEAYADVVGRGPASLLLAMLDLDRFKSLNDELGHHEGDAFLRRFARLGDEVLAHASAFARWGGNQFAALYEGAEARHAESELSSIRKRIGEAHAEAPGESIAASLSVGLADVSDRPPMDDAVARAEHLLYLAKSGGRDRLVTADSTVETTEQRILLAEDDDLTASLIMHRLRREGFDVEHHTEGTRALAAARAGRFALVILDVKMPGMDGFELLRALRGLSKFRETPIVMLTSMGSENDVVRGFDLGATDYVLKPFSPVELIARIHRHLRD